MAADVVAGFFESFSFPFPPFKPDVCVCTVDSGVESTAGVDEPDLAVVDPGRDAVSEALEVREVWTGELDMVVGN